MSLRPPSLPTSLRQKREATRGLRSNTSGAALRVGSAPGPLPSPHPQHRCSRSRQRGAQRVGGRLGEVTPAAKCGAAALALGPLPEPGGRGRGARAARGGGWAPAARLSLGARGPRLGKGVGSAGTLEFRVPTRERGGEIEARGDMGGCSARTQTSWVPDPGPSGS